MPYYYICLTVIVYGCEFTPNYFLILLSLGSLFGNLVAYR